LRRRINVEVETVFTLVLQQRLQPPQVLESALGHPLEAGRLIGDVGQALGAGRRHRVRQLDAVPGQRRARRTEAVGADGRRRVRDAQEHLWQSTPDTFSIPSLAITLSQQMGEVDGWLVLHETDRPTGGYEMWMEIHG
jgi:hypothetical protein